MSSSNSVKNELRKIEQDIAKISKQEKGVNKILLDIRKKELVIIEEPKNG